MVFSNSFISNPYISDEETALERLTDFTKLSYLVSGRVRSEKILLILSANTFLAFTQPEFHLIGEVILEDLVK